MSRTPQQNLAHTDSPRAAPALPWTPGVKLVRRRTGLCAWLLVLLGCLSVEALAETFRIDRIEFVGNDRTVASTLLQELEFSKGERVDEARIETGRQSIMDLGLFKSVQSELSDEGDGHVLTYTVSEKHYWFVLPRLSRSGDGDVSYGANVRLHNLNGRNQTLIVGAKQTELSDSDLDTEEQFRVRFRNPRLFGSRFEMHSDLRLEQGELEEDRGELSGRYGRDLVSLRFGVSRWLSAGRASRGWRLGSDLLLRDFGHEFTSGDPDLYFDATLLSLVSQLEFIDVRDRLFSRQGTHFGYQLHIASDDIGSDASFTRNLLFYRKFIPLGKDSHRNLNFQLRFGYANRTVWGQPAYGLGGADTLRGYERSSLEGNAFVLANFEFLTPVFGRDSLRGVLFTDIGNAFADVHSIELSDLKTSVGLGIRWRIKSLVDTEIRIDYGRGLNDGISKVYASTKATF